MSELRFADKTEILNGLIFKVRNELKGGWSEEVYHQALVYGLQDQDIPVASKSRRSLLHRGTEVHLFEPDIIAWDTIILELKALPYQKEFISAQYAQIIQYLKFFRKEVGLLVNLAPAKVKIKRVVWDESKWTVQEDYEKIQANLSEDDKTILYQIRDCILTLARQYGLGYPETIYRKMLAIEAGYQGLDCIVDVGVKTNWNGHPLPRHITHHLLINHTYLVLVRSLLDYPTVHDFISTKTYLNCLGLQFGLIVNFGKNNLQIYGVQAD